MAVVREKERGTLEQLLVSPLSRWGLMLGKLIPYLCIGMLMAFLLFGIMRFVFFVPIAGSIVAMVAGDVGLRLRSAQPRPARCDPRRKPDAGPSDVDDFHPAERFLFRLYFPARNDAGIFYAFGAVLPTTYFIWLMRAIILRGATFFEYVPSLGVLSLMAVLLFCVCALRFRKKIG